MARLTKTDWQQYGFYDKEMPVSSRADYERYKKLAAYEDYDDLNRLYTLPCNVGDTLYHTNFQMSGEKIEKYTVIRFVIELNGLKIIVRSENGKLMYFEQSMIDRTLFVTPERAEYALKKMPGN